MARPRLTAAPAVPAGAPQPPHPEVPVADDEVEAPKKVIMSKAARRKLKKPPTIVTAEMKENAREELRALRKQIRTMKSNGGRRKMAKLAEKRGRDEDDDEGRVRSGIAASAAAFDEDMRPVKKGRRLESKEWIPYVQTLPDSMLKATKTCDESTAAVTPQPPQPAVLPTRKPKEGDEFSAMEAFAKERRVRSRRDESEDIW